MAGDIITRVHAREVFDSRGTPTVEVEVFCQGGARGRAIVPAGASTGRHEAVELRDGDPTRFVGKGVGKAVAHVCDIIGPWLVGRTVLEQEQIDRTIVDLDGTPNKSKLGANAILGVSLACAHAAAVVTGCSLWRRLAGATEPVLPLPMVNLISGGLHAGGNLDFQDFLLLPVGAKSMREAIQMAVSVYRALGGVLRRHGFEGVLVGDEGGFGPKLYGNEQAIALILEAVTAAGYTPGKDAAIAIDVASTHFYRDGRYQIRLAGEEGLSAKQMISLLAGWVERYPILSIEDALAEDDWDNWKRLTTRLGDQVQLVGDDLFVTNPDRLNRGISLGVANSVLVKVNQIGTLTETLAVIARAHGAGYRPIISARSGETEDSTIADLAVATAAGQIKIGSVARGERLAKYNQLLRIEEELGPAARFAGWQPITRPTG